MRNRNAIVVPAAKAQAANTAMERQGYGPDVFSVPLFPTATPSPNAQPTHYGCSWSMSEADVVAVQQVLTAAGVTFKSNPQNARSFDDAIAADGHHRVSRAAREV